MWTLPSIRWKLPLHAVRRESRSSFSIQPVLVRDGCADLLLRSSDLKLFVNVFILLFWFLSFMCDYPKGICLQRTMRYSLRRRAEWLFLLSLSTAVAVTTSAVFADSATVPVLQKQAKVDEEFSSILESNEKKNSAPFARHETTNNVFDDLCRLHGNLQPGGLFSFPINSQNQVDDSKHPASITVLHEIFDPSVGLVPYISYTSTYPILFPRLYRRHCVITSSSIVLMGRTI